MNEEELELEELYKWLDSVKLSRPKRNVARDFSDGVLVAELLKSFYPRLVEMHNYSPANSFTSKLNNWITLNKKVLKKLDLSLSHEKLSAISSSEPGAIEQFLKVIKKTVENRGERKISGNNEHFSFFIDSNEMSGTMDKENCDWELWQKQAKRFTDDLTKLKNQLSEKEEVIDILQQKVTHLEAMLELKDQRITDLTKQIARYHEQSISSNSTLMSSNL